MYNGLNFKRIYSDKINIDIEQLNDLRRTRIDEKENFKNNDLLVEAISNVKINYKQSRPNVQPTRSIHCSCWQNESFIDPVTESQIESESSRIINVFNQEIIKRFQTFLHEETKHCLQFHKLTWEEFSNDDKIITQLYNDDEDDNIDFFADSNDKKLKTKALFESICMDTSISMLKPISSLCKRIISCFCIKLHDLALLYRLKALKTSTDCNSKMMMDTRPSNYPLIYHIQAKNILDLLLLPLLFKEMNLEAPLLLINDSPYTNKLKFILDRLGYAIQNSGITYGSLTDIIFSIKLCKIVQQNKSICIVDVLSGSTRETTDDRLSSRSILSIAKYYLKGLIHDPIIIPLMINHEFVPKVFHFTSNSFWTCNWMLSMLSLFNSCECGTVNLSVLTPIYLSRFNSQAISSLHTDNRHTQMESNIHKLIKHIDVFNDRSQILMPTNLVAFILLYWYPKNQSTTTINEVSKAMDMMIKYVIPKELVHFSTASLRAIVLRGINKLSHLMSITKSNQSNDEYNFVLKINYANVDECLELDFYADVVIRTIKLRAAAVLSFAFNVEFNPQLRYQDYVKIPVELFESQYRVTLQKLLVRYFRFRLTCESLDSIVTTDLTSWWNETLVSATKSTDDEWQQEIPVNNSAIDFYTGDRSKSGNEGVFVYLADETRVLPIFSVLLRCLGPRMEARFLITQIILELSDSFIQSAVYTDDLWKQFQQVVHKKAANQELRFAQTLNQDHFISTLVALFACNTIQIFDMNLKKERNLIYSYDWQKFCCNSYRFSLIKFDRDTLLSDSIYNNQLMAMLYVL